MRIYGEDKEHELTPVICNACGKKLKVEKGILKEGCFRGEDRFGYFSGKDGETHSFDLCEECYDKMIKDFAVPVQVQEETELL